MKKTIHIIGLCMLLSKVSYAANTAPSYIYHKETVEVGVITGTVADANGMPIAYASVEVFKEDKLINGTLTDGDGKFLIPEMAVGDYILKITVAGMKPYLQDFKISSAQTDLGNIMLNTDVIQLNDVTVRAETSKITSQIDKRVIEVGKDLVSAGATAGDVLNNIPSLNVDQQTGDLSLRGNSNVRVFLDGKPSSIPVSELLKQLPSNAIEKVEIITNPSAKYDPEGNSGIINIITTKEKRKGYNVGINTGYTHGKKDRYNASINANWNTGNLNLFGNYSTNFGQNKFVGSFDNLTTGIKQAMDIFSDNSSQMIKVGFDWFINDQSAVTLYTNQGFRNSDRNFDSTIHSSQINLSFLDQSVSTDDNRNQDYSLNYSLDFKKEGHSIELDAFYSKAQGDEDTDFDWESPLLNLSNVTLADDLRYFNQTQDQEITNKRLKVDYTLPFIEKGSIEAGFNYNQEGTDNTLLTTQFLPAYNQNGETIDAIAAQDTYFDFRRDVTAGYFNLKYQFDKIGAQIGVRGEQVDLEAKTVLFGSQDLADEQGIVDRNNFNWYPSVFLTYQATEADQFSINYSRRVDRPGVWSLSPIRQWQSATTRQEGNPNLKPQFTDSYELGYMHSIGRKGSINASVFYRQIHDEMSRFAYLDEANPNITILKRDNIDDNQSYGAEISWFYKANNWWSTNGGLNYYQSTLKSTIGRTGQDLEVDVTNFTARLSNDFVLAPTWKLQLFTMYFGPQDNLQGTRESMFRQDIGLSKSFFNKSLNLSTRYSDVFNTFYAKMNMNNPQNQIGEFHWESQVFYIGLSYNFGGKVKTRADKQRNQSEVDNQSMGF